MSSLLRLLEDLIKSRLASFFARPTAPPPAQPPAAQPTPPPTAARPLPPPEPAPPAPPPETPPPYLPPGARREPLPFGVATPVLYWKQLGPDCYEVCHEGGVVNWVGECVPILVDMARTGELDRAHEECERAAGLRP